MSQQIKPMCRFFYLGQCKKGANCLFRHPEMFVPRDHKEMTRNFNTCYCGARLKKIPHRYNNGNDDDDDKTFFYTVCAKTNKNMRECGRASATCQKIV